MMNKGTNDDWILANRIDDILTVAIQVMESQPNTREAAWLIKKARKQAWSEPQSIDLIDMRVRYQWNAKLAGVEK